LIVNFRTPFTGAFSETQQGVSTFTLISPAEIGFVPVQSSGQEGFKLVLNFKTGPGADATFVGDHLVQFGYTPQSADGFEIRAVELQIDATAQAAPQASSIVDVLDFQNYPNTGFLATNAAIAFDPSFSFPPQLTDHIFLEVPSLLSTGESTFSPLTTQISDFVTQTSQSSLTSATFLFTMEPVIPAPPPAPLTYTNIDLPGVVTTVASNINNSGQIVGSYVDSLGTQHGFVTEKDGGFTTIDFPGAVSTTGLGINDKGEVTGSYTDDAGIVHGFLLRDGNLSPFDFPGSIFMLPITINNKGQIVGEYQLGTAGDQNVHGFLFDNGSFNTIDEGSGQDGFFFTEAIGTNSRGEVVGDFFDPNLFRGFIGRNSIFQAFEVPSQSDVFLGAINARGDYVGIYGDTNLVQHGFLNQHGSFLTVDFPGADTTFALGINSSGTMVGTYTNSDGTTHAFLAQPGQNNHSDARIKTSTTRQGIDKPVCGSAEWRRRAQSVHTTACKPGH